MPTITLVTPIRSSITTCFDLSRSIDLHQVSTSQTNERAIGGRITGLINGGEWVTWEATHFGIKQKLTSKITGYNRPFNFRDEQLKGAFRYFVHDHTFEERDGMVMMKDVFTFRSPFGYVGKLVDKVILTRYLRKFLTGRNLIIKEYAETDKWKLVLPGNTL
jgi:ligand-binding SRPBCC domain-containing protein